MNTYTSLLYDTLLQLDFTDYVTGAPLSKSLQQCESKVFEVSNIAYYLDQRYEQELPDPNELYDVFPPFSCFWLEYAVPHSLSRSGVLWHTTRINGSWDCLTQFFEQDKNKISHLPGAIEFRLDAQGKHETPLFAVHPPETASESETREMYEPEQTRIGADLTTCFQALAFCNLHKNCVKIEENQPSRQVRRAAERSGKQPPALYKTLLIRGMGGGSSGGSGSGNGGEYALRIVRGHMIRATPERPLFGKPWGVGTFWVASHTRGNAKHGKIVNQYQVEIPEESHHVFKHGA